MNAPDSQLAIRGGAPAIAEGPPAWPPPDDDVRTALLAAYEDGSWGHYDGPHCARLAESLVDMHGVEHVLLCSSGTVAVEIALRGLKVSAGDEVILAGYDFPGNFRAIEAIGARPVLVDLGPGSWVLEPANIAAAVGPATRAVIVSHLHGNLADMLAIRDIAAARSLAVLEDACQCPGAQVQGKPAGAWGDAAVMSFGGSKLLTAGRGGALLTPHAEVHQRAKIYNERGNQAFPLSELQAAVLLPQLAKLAKRNARRGRAVQKLISACGKLDGLKPLQSQVADSAPAYYKMAWMYEAAALEGNRREQFIAAVQAEGVAIDAGFRGFARRGARRCRTSGELAHSAAAAAATLLLHHPVLLEDDETITRVAGAIRKVIAGLNSSE